MMSQKTNSIGSTYRTNRQIVETGFDVANDFPSISSVVLRFLVNAFAKSCPAFMTRIDISFTNRFIACFVAAVRKTSLKSNETQLPAVLCDRSKTVL